jgi:phosphoglycolate phosphatase-like HAD superfamily hydrolase
MTRLILFDVDLTLVTTGGAGRKAMNTVFERLFGIHNPTRGVSFDGRTDFAIFMETLKMHRLIDGRPSEVYQRVVDAYLGELATTIGTTGGQVLPGVGELLDALGNEKAAVGLATGNLRRGAEIKLGQYGLWERFAAGGFGDRTSVRAEVVSLAIRTLAEVAWVDADPAQAVVIGDTPLDIEAAHLAGARALGVATGNYTVEQLTTAGADWAVPDLGETGRVIEYVFG